MRYFRTTEASVAVSEASPPSRAEMSPAARLSIVAAVCFDEQRVGPRQFADRCRRGEPDGWRASARALYRLRQRNRGEVRIGIKRFEVRRDVCRTVSKDDGALISPEAVKSSSACKGLKVSPHP